MQIIKLKPINNNTRHTILLQKNLLIKNSKIFKNLRTKIPNFYGRSKSSGQITSWHKQQGYKKLYRNLINNTEPSKSIILGISYDPNRNTFISINFDLEQKKFFNDLTITNTYPGTLIERNIENSELRSGFRFQLKDIPTGSLITNICEKENLKTKYAKAAGTFSQLLEKNNITAYIKLPSKKKIELPVTSFATIGTMSNDIDRNIVIGKAGRSRNLGKRPIVRGIAMNPVDHPHGGRTNGGRPSVTPWGLPTKNKFKLKKK
jgi:large subunit ribosomal protein L2